MSKLFSASIPVNAAISCMISQAKAKNNIPRSPQIMAWDAWARDFESPPEVINFIPAQTKTTTKAIKAPATERLIILEKSSSSWVAPAASISLLGRSGDGEIFKDINS